ncbi:hypothetical protein [Gimesia sp.]|uniref:hypothetical protein n=1 Tax=Gimesia sp. TaxID=2024833 RepID=UPI000C47C979|nr:hypothetical protein [Gimesia sp.]MAX38082.1 hypothetical protein [Gimesia sp.]HAH43881.1 hypothetical protein [Planctomycetaceae bacterium]HBL45738.1 hypothetical protein [Planctomycetaceae bacterium]|tara:strand:- start:1773 stop:2000 length:228 start_codon:yes stop_codon:yes gene_type:complete
MRVISVLVPVMLVGCTSEGPALKPSGARLPTEAARALQGAPDWELFSLDPGVEKDPDDASSFHVANRRKYGVKQK